MSEEIIIDGVDVAECCFYNNGKCNNPNGMACNCINNTVCYFKEFKRLQAENKRLKDAIKSINKPVFLPNIEQEATNKYRKALEEIRENLQENCNQCFEIDNFTKPDDCGICEWARVLKVISEVLK